MTAPPSKSPSIDSPGMLHDAGPPYGTPRWIAPSQLQSLIDILRIENYRVLAPTLDQHAIVYDEITSIRQLPKGYSDSQAPAVYQLTQTPSAPENQKLFHFNLGPHSPKQFLFPPNSILPGPQKAGPQKADFNDADSNQSSDSSHEPQLVQRMAILGLRACELAAIAIQDRVLMSPPFIDSQYALRRKSLFVIAVQCTTAASTCFCPSMNTGPELPGPDANPITYDLALTELVPSNHSQFTHGFLIQAGSRRGQVILDQLPSEEPTPEILEAKKQTIEAVHKKIQRAMPSGPSNIDGQPGDLRDALLARLNHPHWQNVADRCLSCANCTMVCPTCFCSSVDEVSDLLNESSIRQRHWDSCFNPDFSHTSGAPVRNTVRSRYRQWLTHKLATWFDQFDSSGCVGCGRCITWCPVGIDLTQEVAKLLEPSDAPLLNVPPRLHHR
jgi:sulfhydrogenase subunit beta (sulfur reductase)